MLTSPPPLPPDLLKGHTAIALLPSGSRLYGTALPTSDHDWKVVTLPPPADLLLQRVPGPFPLKLPVAGTSEACSTHDIEVIPLHHYLSQVTTGQTLAVEMLFAPPRPHPIIPVAHAETWNEIRASALQLLIRGPSGLQKYVQTQASRFFVKTRRLSALQTALESLHSLPPATRLNEHLDTLATLCTHTLTQPAGFLDEPAPLIRLTDVTSPNTPANAPVPHLEIVDRAYALTCRIQYVCDQLSHRITRYGPRAQQAMTQQGVEWKALMHALRVAEQAIELYRTTTITFPRPNHAHLRAIRQGQVVFPEVLQILEARMLTMQHAAATSSLPLDPNPALADHLVIRTYHRHLCLHPSLHDPQPPPST